MATRPLGRTGHRCSLVTFGGYALHEMEQEQADRAVGEMLDAGVNGFDVAPSYGDAEAKLGPALAGKRDRVFLQCKTLERTREGAEKELRASLERLRTDHFDLYQCHGVGKAEELDQILGPGGAMEAFLQARQAGVIRFIGITGHRPAVLLEGLRRLAFDTVMAPVNFVMQYGNDFAGALLAEAERRGVGVLAIKSQAAEKWKEDEERKYPRCWYRPLEDDHHTDLAVRFALSQPIASVVAGADLRLHRKAVAAAARFRPLDDAEQDELRRLAAGLEPLFA